MLAQHDYPPLVSMKTSLATLGFCFATEDYADAIKKLDEIETQVRLVRTWIWAHEAVEQDGFHK